MTDDDTHMSVFFSYILERNKENWSEINFSENIKIEGQKLRYYANSFYRL